MKNRYSFIQLPQFLIFKQIASILMPPKPAPKLTKQQIKALAIQQAKKKEQQQIKRKQQEQIRIAQQSRLNEIQRQKLAEQQKQRIQQQKVQYQPILTQRIKNQEKVLEELRQSQEWNNATQQYFKNYDVKGTNLSTFLNIFRDQTFKTPQKSLEFCQEAQIISAKLHQQILSYRANSDQKKQKEAISATRELHKIEMEKLQEIMIWMANQAEDMEQKNNQFARNKGEPNKKVQGRKLLEYIHNLSKSFKIGMFLNSTTTKAINKFRPIQIKQFGLNTQIPSKWINANTIVKFQWVNFDPFENDQKQSFHIMGGVYNLQFYQLFMGSKKINTISLKKYFKGKQILQKFKLQTSLIKQPFQLQYKIPSHIYLNTMDQSSLQFAQFDISINKWVVLPNDTVQQYNVAEKKVICKVGRPQPIAYIQDKCTDYPYVAWELRTVEDGKVLLDIQLKRYLPKKPENQDRDRLIVTFEIQDNLVRLSLNDDCVEFKDLCENYQTPESLLAELSRRGVHLLPDDFDYLQAKVPKKDSDTQKNAIRSIAYGVQSFYIRSEPHNTCQIIVKIRENLDHESIFLEDQQKDWKVIHWKNDRCWVSNRNIKEKHLNLQILLKQHQFCDKECLQRIKFDRKYLLRHSIMKMLTLTRILSFTTSKAEPSRLKQILKQKILV